MMKEKRYWIAIVYIVIGVILIALGFAGMVDEFCNGMGSALLVVGVIKLLRFYRFNKNEAYREKIEIETNDERNHFIRNKAWAWAGYLFVMIMAVACIVLRIVGLDAWSMAASGIICLMLVLFWISYLILQRKF